MPAEIMSEVIDSFHMDKRTFKKEWDMLRGYIHTWSNRDFHCWDKERQKQNQIGESGKAEREDSEKQRK